MAKRRYSVGAAFADVYVSGMALGAAATIYVVISNRPVSWWIPLVELPVIVLLVILYHACMARKVKFLSPGELIMGRRFQEEAKEWFNPYGANRIGLFIILFIAIVYAGNSWDHAADERVYHLYTLPQVLFRIVALGCLVTGMVMAGTGNLLGGILIALYFAIQAAGFFIYSPDVLGAGEDFNVVMHIAGFFMLLMCLITGVVFFAYGIRRRRNKPV